MAEHTRLILALGVFGAALTGCGPGAGGMGADADTGMTADANAGFRVLPPNIDWLDAGVPPIAPPSLTPCPEGWREVASSEEGDPVTCAPYPEGGAKECADGWAHFMGELDCMPVGAPCPRGDFPEGLPSDQPVLYVLAGAGGGGDGSEGAPLATIAEAMALAAPGTVIALGKGVYDEPVYLAAGVTLWGACAADTRLTAASSDLTVRGVVHVFTADVRLQNVRIGPAEIPGLVVGARASIAVEGVLIEGVRSTGLLVTDRGWIHGRTLCVSDTRADSAGRRGFGVSAAAGSTVDLRGVLLSRNGTAGIAVSDVDTSVTLTDLVVRDTRSQESNRMFGRGLDLQQGATAEVTRALFEGNRNVSISAVDVGTSVTLTDLVVRDTQSQERDRANGRGLGVQAGATAHVTRALFERNRQVAIHVSKAGTSVTLTDLVVRETQSQESDRTGGRALNVQEGAAAHVTRALFARNRDVGIHGSDLGTSLTLTDLVVRDTQGRESDGTFGRGLNLQVGVTAEVTRALFERSRDGGVLVLGVGASATLTDLVIRDTKGRESDGQGGRGLSVQGGATTEVTRALLEENRDVGIHVSDVGTSVTLTDVVVRNTQGRDSDGMFGRGLSVQFGATTDVVRALFAHNHEFGVIAQSEGTMVGLTDIVATETARQACAATTCPEQPHGVGLASMMAATMTAAHFAVTDSALCGVFLAANGELDLSAGQVSGSPVGVCLQVEDYAVTRLTDGVVYVDNDTNLDATTLPLPELSEPVDPTP